VWGSAHSTSTRLPIQQKKTDRSFPSVSAFVSVDFGFCLLHKSSCPPPTRAPRRAKLSTNSSDALGPYAAPPTHRRLLVSRGHAPTSHPFPTCKNKCGCRSAFVVAVGRGKLTLPSSRTLDCRWRLWSGGVARTHARTCTAPHQVRPLHGPPHRRSLGDGHPPRFLWPICPLRPPPSPVLSVIQVPLTDKRSARLGHTRRPTG
jgi:hypothetical protein